MAEGRYRVRAKDGSFSFTIEMNGSAGKYIFRDGSWDISDQKNLKALAPLFVPGKWRYQPLPARAPGALWFKSGISPNDPGIMMFKEVPDDYVHGPFCSASSGEGVIFPNNKDEIAIEWEIVGPGCV